MTSFQYNAQDAEEAVQKHKSNELFKMEAAWRTKIEALTGEHSVEKPDYSWSDYGTSIITEVIQNIQVK